ERSQSGWPVNHIVTSSRSIRGAGFSLQRRPDAEIVSPASSRLAHPLRTGKRVRLLYDFAGSIVTRVTNPARIRRPVQRPADLAGFPTAYGRRHRPEIALLGEPFAREKMAAPDMYPTKEAYTLAGNRLGIQRRGVGDQAQGGDGDTSGAASNAGSGLWRPVQ